MLQTLHQHWAAVTIAAAWLLRERLNILAAGAWLVASGGVIGIARKLLFGIEAGSLKMEDVARPADPAP